MRLFLGGALAALAAVGAATAAEERTRLYSDPAPPAREVLDRLNLRLAWRAYVPIDDRRDGLFSVQMDARQLFVQTRSGMVAVYDADGGQAVWRTRVGRPYQGAQPLAWNSRSLFVLSGTKLYALDRNNGTTQWEYDVPPGVSAPPVADELQLYLCTSVGRVYAYELPHLAFRGGGDVGKPAPSSDKDKPAGDKMDPDKKLAPPEPKTTENSGYGNLNDQLGGVDISNPAPIPVWDADVRLRLEFAPLLSDTSLILTSPTGAVSAVSKFPTTNLGTTEVFRAEGPGALGVPPGRFDDLLFLGGLNGEVQALSISREGETRWRYAAGSPVIRKPVAIDVGVGKDRVDQDVYVVTERQGLARLTRDTGDPAWRVPRGKTILSAVPEADRFLAANRKFVYAADKSGRLLVLDRGRGTLLSSYDFRDFVFPIVNETTDRLFLAAHNGLLVCLHDKEFTAPVNHRYAEERAFDVKRLPPVDYRVKDEMTRKTGVKLRELGPPGDPMPLRRLLNEVERRYNLRIDIVSDKTFREAKLEPIADQPASFVRADEEKTLKEVLDLTLAQVNAHVVVHDRLYVVPGKVGGMDMGDKPADKDKPMDKDKKDK